MATVGYLEVGCMGEMIASIFISLILSGVFGFTLSEIGEITSNITKKSKELNAKINNINYFMKARDIDNGLQSKIRAFIEYSHQEQQEGFLKGKELISELSHGLQKELQENTYYQALAKIELLQNNFSNEFLKELCQQVKEKSFGVDELITKEKSSCDLFIIINGEVGLNLVYDTYDAKYKEVFKLKYGENYGLKELFTGFPTYYKSISKSACMLVHLTRKKFLETLQKFPKDQQIFYELKHILTFNKEQKLIYEQCKSCGKFNHNILECRLLNYLPNKYNVYAQYRKNINQERGSFQRNIKRNINAWDIRPQFKLIEDELGEYNEDECYTNFNIQPSPEHQNFNI